MAVICIREEDVSSNVICIPRERVEYSVSFYNYQSNMLMDTTSNQEIQINTNRPLSSVQRMGRR